MYYKTFLNNFERIITNKTIFCVFGDNEHLIEDVVNILVLSLSRAGNPFVVHNEKIKIVDTRIRHIFVGCGAGIKKIDALCNIKCSDFHMTADIFSRRLSLFGVRTYPGVIKFISKFSFNDQIRLLSVVCFLGVKVLNVEIVRLLLKNVLDNEKYIAELLLVYGKSAFVDGSIVRSIDVSRLASILKRNILDVLLFKTLPSYNDPVKYIKYDIDIKKLKVYSKLCKKWTVGEMKRRLMLAIQVETTKPDILAWSKLMIGW